ncbi:MAG: DMT family transporter [Candidatus Adiutrix sp.]|jgi:drug/metabolite transporter (DMT)-like permease|nr:DMT family transporter [Candidatus Adiutrix sp.]
MPLKIRALCLLLAATFIWGFSYPISLAALKEISPWALAGLRYMFGALSLAPLVLRRRAPTPPPASGRLALWFWGGLLSGCCLSCGAVMQLYGLARTPASQVGFMTSLYVSLVPVLAFIFDALPPRPAVLAGLAASLTGLYLLAGGSLEGFGPPQSLILAADVFWALQVIITGRLALRDDANLFMLTQAATSAALTLSLTAMFGYWPSWPAFIHTLPFTMFGILSVGVGYICQTRAQRVLPPTSAALLFPLQSVMAAAAGVFFLGESMNQRMLWGAAAIILGCLIPQFAREPLQLTPGHPSYRAALVLRLALGASLALGTAGSLVWVWSAGG